MALKHAHVTCEKWIIIDDLSLALAIIPHQYMIWREMDSSEYKNCIIMYPIQYVVQ